MFEGLEVFWAGALVVGVAFVGSLIAVLLIGTVLRKSIPFLTSFAAGVFLIVALTLLTEAVAEASTLLVVLFVATGFIGVSLLVRAIPEAHHHCEGEDCPPHSPLGARKILFADSLHNVADGLVLGSAFLLNTTLGMTVTVGIVFHELVQEISEFFVLKRAGYSTRRALLFNVLVALTIFIGIGLAVFLKNISSIEWIILSIASGAFLHIVFEDLWPHSLMHAKEHSSLYTHAFFAILGALIMLGIFFGIGIADLGHAHG